MKLGCFLIMLFFCQSIWAKTPSLAISPQITQTITKTFTKSLPSLKIDSIESTPISNLYQINSGPVVMYVTQDGHYAISGDILDLLDGKTNLTDIARRKALAQALDKFGESNMIVYAPPAAVKIKHTATVFVDLDCAHCRKFHSQIENINQLGIKVRYMAFPKTGKNTPAYDTLVSIWCAGDRKAAFNKANLDEPITALKCKNQNVEQQFKLGVMSGISGTPTIVIDGQIIAGYVDPDELLAIAQNLKKL